MAANPTPIHDLATLYDVAGDIFPNVSPPRNYDRLRRIVERNERFCPIQFVYLPCRTNGRTTRCLLRSQVPELKQWVEAIRRGGGRHE